MNKLPPLGSKEVIAPCEAFQGWSQQSAVVELGLVVAACTCVHLPATECTPNIWEPALNVNLVKFAIMRNKRWYLNMLLLRQGAPKLNHFRLIFSELPCQILLSHMELHPISRTCALEGTLGTKESNFISSYMKRWTSRWSDLSVNISHKFTHSKNLHSDFGSFSMSWDKIWNFTHWL